MSDQTDIIIEDPAQWRAGDKVTIEGTLSADLNGALRLGKNGLLVRSRLSGGVASALRDDTVTIRRPASPLPDKPGDVFYATVDGQPGTQVMVLAGQSNFCRFPNGKAGYCTIDCIDPSTVRRVRLVAEDEQ